MTGSGNQNSTEPTSSVDSCRGNLPSPLTPMEQLHLLRDSDENPNAILARLILEGEIDRELLEQAAKFITTRHEIMLSKLSSNRKRWEASPADEPQWIFRWHPEEYDSRQHEIQPVRPSSGPGCVCDVFIGARQINLFMQMHHVKVDGLGAIQAIRETMQVYHNLVTGRAIDEGLHRLNNDLFPKRGRIGLFQKGWWKRLPLQWIPVYGAVKFALAKVSHLLPDWKQQSPLAPLQNLPTYFQKKLAPAVYQNLRQGNESANERLLAGLFLAVDRFQCEIDQDRGNKKIRIVVPISIRERADLRGTACNRVALIQLDRGDRDFADPAGLVWGINYELGIVSKYKFEKAFGIGLRMMAMVPPLFRWRIGRPVVQTTTVLTNLGNPFRSSKLPEQDGCIVLGDMKLVDVHLLPPVNDLAPAVFLFSAYAGAPAITISFDQRVISPEQAERLLDLYIEELEGIAPA